MVFAKKVICAISGGVDSCVAALLLKKQGYHVRGVFMRNWDITDETGSCDIENDRNDAMYICKKLSIDFFEVDFVKDYWNNVFCELVRDYQHGLTPNPDILCNKRIKFDAFLKYALGRMNADVIATGHYARTTLDSDGNTHLLKGIDELKDQTFFLSQISQEALKKCIFPLGIMIKNDVKKIAYESGFDKIAAKKESMGICFIGRRKFQNFINDYVEPRVGNFINIENKQIVGRHKGIHNWTIGQRCMIPGQPTAFYVAEKDTRTQDILVAPGTEHPSLYHQSVVTDAPHLISDSYHKLFKESFFECDFRFQHRKPLIKCLLHSDNTGHLHVLLKKPLKALTPGQFAVFYQGSKCLGSARIIYRGPSLYTLSLAKNISDVNDCDKDIFEYRQKII